MIALEHMNNKQCCYNAVENVTQLVHEAGNLKFSTNLAVGP